MSFIKKRKVLVPISVLFKLCNNKINKITQLINLTEKRKATNWSFILNYVCNLFINQRKTIGTSDDNDGQECEKKQKKDESISKLDVFSSHFDIICQDIC